MKTLNFGLKELFIGLSIMLFLGVLLLVSFIENTLFFKIIEGIIAIVLLPSYAFNFVEWSIIITEV